MTKGKLSLIACSLAVAAGLFLARMLISPPVTEAATPQGLSPDQMTIAGAKDLPSFDDKYQRHMGILDTLETHR